MENVWALENPKLQKSAILISVPFKKSHLGFSESKRPALTKTCPQLLLLVTWATRGPGGSNGSGLGPASPSLSDTLTPRAPCKTKPGSVFPGRQRGGSFPYSLFLPQPQPQEAGSLRDAEQHLLQVWEQNTFCGSSKDTGQL